VGTADAHALAQHHHALPAMRSDDFGKVIVRTDDGETVEVAVGVGDV
jgi:hypothetical protein